MQRTFSVEEIPDPYWVPPPGAPAPVQPLAGATAPPMNRSSSEWMMQKFLEENGLDSPKPNPNTNLSSVSSTNGGGVDLPRLAGANAAPMNRSSSEWMMQKFLEENGLDSPKPNPTPNPNLSSISSTNGGGGGVDPVKYNAMLKQQLEKDLATVAMWRSSVAMAPESSVADSSSLISDSSHMNAQVYGVKGNGIPMQNKFVATPSGMQGPCMVQSVDISVKPANSSSSKEPSDDDDLEGEAETTENMDLTEGKLMRRKQSNRESARRSRSRKAAHLTEFEGQLSQLRMENSSLLRQLADVNQNYNDAAVDNRILKADVETLRTKVKMAEDSVKRVTGMSPYPIASDMSSLSMPFSSTSSGATSGSTIPIQDNPNHYFQATPHSNGANTYMNAIPSSNSVDDFINGAITDGNMGRAASLQPVASLEHLQKRIYGGPSPSWDSAALDPKGTL